MNARLEAVVKLKLRGPDLREVDLDAIVDSGFTASLTLPMTLGLIRQSSSEALLADGTVRQFDLQVVEVQWQDDWQPILISAVGSEALIGMRLLAKSELRIAVVDGGRVAITRIS